jgi:hypothetical protein
MQEQRKKEEEEKLRLKMLQKQESNKWITEKYKI